jgi:HEAT repeat protein
MSLEIILFDKSLKPSQKPGLLSKFLLENPQQVNELVLLAIKAKDADKANCIEALEHATLSNPEIATEECFNLVVESLASKAPRVKWESARVIANTAHRFQSRLPEAVPNLLANTEDPGTVVRWSAATALAAIVKQKTTLNNTLLPALESLAEKEEKNSIRKIYLDGIKKANK